LAADHNDRRARDHLEERSSISAIEKRTNLPLMLLWRRPHHHGLECSHQNLISASVLMHHRGKPTIGQSGHAVLEREINEHLPLTFFSLAYWMNACV
jgi:hypothetical protein